MCKSYPRAKEDTVLIILETRFQGMPLTLMKFDPIFHTVDFKRKSSNSSKKYNMMFEEIGQLMKVGGNELHEYI